jgi:hypothetical protein
MSYCLEQIVNVDGRCLHFAFKTLLMCHVRHHQTMQQACLTASQPCQPDDSTVVSPTAGGVCQRAGIQVDSSQGNGSTIPGFEFSPWHYVPASTTPGHHPVSLFSSSVPILHTNDGKASNNKPVNATAVCEDILTQRSVCCDSAFAHKKEFCIF